MLPKQLILCWIAIVLTCVQVLHAQCPVPLSPPDSSPSDLLVSNGETLSNGITKWYKNTGTLASLTISGGTFIVDGHLTIDNITINSGHIYIKPGASLSIQNNIILQGGAKVFNYGSLYALGHYYMMGPSSPSSPNCLVNATPTSSISTPGSSVFIADPNSTFINNGHAQLGYIQTLSNAASGSVVLNDGSETNVRYLIIDKENTIDAPGGKACMSVSTSSSRVSKQITSSPNLKIGFMYSDACSGCTADPWGGAQVFTNVPSCAGITPLPIKLMNFSVINQSTCNILTWDVEASNKQVALIIERSIDGTNFKELAHLKKSANTSYLYKDCAPTEGNNYYRIKVKDERTGEISYSKVLSSKSTRPTTISTSPNPFIDKFTVRHSLPISEKYAGTLRNSMGQQVDITIYKHSNTLTVHTSRNIQPGIYFFQLATDAGIHNYRLVKQ